MDEQREEELLLHVAAGTDLLTAFAALPREDGSPSRSTSTFDLSFSAVMWGVVAVVGVVASLLLI